MTKCVPIQAGAPSTMQQHLAPLRKGGRKEVEEALGGNNVSISIILLILDPLIPVDNQELAGCTVFSVKTRWKWP